MFPNRLYVSLVDVYSKLLSIIPNHSSFIIHIIFFTIQTIGVEGKKYLEQGDKILLPESAFNQLVQMEVSYPMVFRLGNMSNPSAPTIHCGVMEFTADDGVAYVPSWMMEHIRVSEGNQIEVINVTVPKATFIQIRPHLTAFIELANPRVVLEHALRNFATLTQGSTIRITHAGHVFLIDIVETKPTKAVLVIETDLQVDFLPPADAEEVAERKRLQQEARKAEALFNFGASPAPAAAAAAAGRGSPSLTPSKATNTNVHPSSLQSTLKTNSDTNTVNAKPTPPSSSVGSTSKTMAGKTSTAKSTSTFATLGPGKSLLGDGESPQTPSNPPPSSLAALRLEAQARHKATQSQSQSQSQTQTQDRPTPSNPVVSPMASQGTTPMTTKTVGNFVYYYDTAGKLVKRVPKTQVNTKFSATSNGRSLQ